MTPQSSEVGIRYPDRAEGVRRYSDYKVFVDFWKPLTNHLAEQVRVLSTRHQTKILAIHGEQGSGKTLFSTQLLEDHAASRQRRDGPPDAENLWDQITSKLPPAEFRTVTESAVCRDVPDDIGWIDAIKKWRGSQSDTTIIAIADNSETDYFLRGLVGERHPDATRTNDAFLETAAGNLVKEARREDVGDRQGLTGMLLIMLSNDRSFLEAFKKKVDAQHRGMMEIMDLPLPTSSEKERAVRVNVNRLNSVSYWYCLDKGGDEQRKKVRARLVDATTFPDTFDAVDQALKYGRDRTGRPGKKNLLTLVCLTSEDSVQAKRYAITSSPLVEAQHKWAASYSFESEWASACGLPEREAGLLESEWQLRIVALGEPFVAALLAAAPMDQLASSWSSGSYALTERLLKVFQKQLGSTSRTAAREKYAADIEKIVDGWLPDVSQARTMLDSFWKAGQARSARYEKQLAMLLGAYNQQASGYLSARPDFVVSKFVPAALTSSPSDVTRVLTDAIQRNANAMEFTSQETASPKSIATYLGEKLPNYLRATQEQ